jgi:uncharacterized protein YbbC (DUF1343 family)
MERKVNKKFSPVLPGVDVFLEQHLNLAAGLRAGLLTNHSGLDHQGRPTVDLLAHHPDVRLTALFSPEHGIRGNAQAGEFVPSAYDPATGLPIHSLYGQGLSPAPGTQDDLDEVMRDFDTREEGKLPDEAVLSDLDVLICDLQDVGTRVYTYAATMAYCMRACARKGIRFLVLDRPNPINGLVLEGPILEYPGYSSFVGLFPVPLRHGMTIGELALLYNGRFLEKPVELTVIPLRGWERRMWFDETGLPWVGPSPNLPDLTAATVYPGQVLCEGTNLSEGRGTRIPFLLCGAPWIDENSLAEKLDRLGLPGIRFQGTRFHPGISKYAGRECSGIRLRVTDRDAYKPLAVAIHVLAAVLSLYPDQLEFYAHYFDRISGTDQIRLSLQQGLPVSGIVHGFERGLAEFRELRNPFLLYT